MKAPIVVHRRMQIRLACRSFCTQKVQAPFPTNYRVTTSFTARFAFRALNAGLICMRLCNTISDFIWLSARPLVDACNAYCNRANAVTHRKRLHSMTTARTACIGYRLIAQNVFSTHAECHSMRRMLHKLYATHRRACRRNSGNFFDAQNCIPLLCWIPNKQKSACFSLRLSF